MNQVINIQEKTTQKRVVSEKELLHMIKVMNASFYAYVNNVCEDCIELDNKIYKFGCNTGLQMYITKMNTEFLYYVKLLSDENYNRNAIRDYIIACNETIKNYYESLNLSNDIITKVYEDNNVGIIKFLNFNDNLINILHKLISKYDYDFTYINELAI
ncbi:hypothetical protein DEFDS_P235 (plasmid) [Deferribacter desulfuricans SSM1]|uniref:Uncharacterized protein n=1 Tax=Deferribacter desulfuricans (strain DSM 14783 / JCM 11476 / NBRC 101012 / SSM1) TaxID=639282 RepID=D3PF63_DEFDS|nr:hypothetical protein [Deferribacter desulfuricans]BAI81855.1 hypothetical protein DEFDS_P235 [Deferribacter desulfuricans SSM1]